MLYKEVPIESSITVFLCNWKTELTGQLNGKGINRKRLWYLTSSQVLWTGLIVIPFCTNCVQLK